MGGMGISDVPLVWARSRPWPLADRGKWSPSRPAVREEDFPERRYRMAIAGRPLLGCKRLAVFTERCVADVSAVVAA